jgi:pimeloyl-ACP methyl ester carboxylesterase
MATGLASTTLAFDRLFYNLILRASLCMVRFDPRGHGLTDKPTDPAAYNSSRYAEDVEAIVNAYSLVKPFFAGWSLGAAIAPDLAAYYPSRLPFSGFISYAGMFCHCI